jgi:raffinose/stachyose/melibiose transport system permease protein
MESGKIVIPMSNLYSKRKKRKLKLKGRNIAMQLVLLIWGVIVLLPLLWLLLSSLKTQSELTLNVWGLPKTFQFKNYLSAWNRGHLGLLMFNSFVTTAVSIIISVVCSTTIAYALSRFRFKLNRLFYYLIIAGMMIPIHSAVIPIYMTVMKLNLMNSRLVLGFIYAAFRIPISVFILEGFMISIPKELEECAIIDGCSYPTIFRWIILPLSKDGIITITVLTSLSSWNEMLVSMLLLGKPEVKTLPIGVMGFIAEFASQYSLLCAGLVIASVPNIIFYMFMQEKIVKGMTMGAIKG